MFNNPNNQPVNSLDPAEALKNTPNQSVPTFRNALEQSEPELSDRDTAISEILDIIDKTANEDKTLEAIEKANLTRDLNTAVSVYAQNPAQLMELLEDLKNRSLQPLVDEVLPEPKKILSSIDLDGLEYDTFDTNPEGNHIVEGLEEAYKKILDKKNDNSLLMALIKYFRIKVEDMHFMTKAIGSLMSKSKPTSFGPDTELEIEAQGGVRLKLLVTKNSDNLASLKVSITVPNKDGPQLKSLDVGELWVDSDGTIQLK